MNAKRIGVMVLVVVAIFALALNVVGAQDNQGNGNGNGNGNQNGNGYGQGNANQYGSANRPGQTAGNGAGYQGGRNADAAFGMGIHQNLPAATVDVLPPEVVDLMLAGWLDEQHAYAVYGVIMDEFGDLRPFVNIQRSETQHIAAWEYLFDRYGIEVPALPSFDLPTFSSVSDACTAGAATESVNFELYDTMLAVFEPYPDLLQVAESLRDASEFNHLPVLEQCAG